MTAASAKYDHYGGKTAVHEDGVVHAKKKALDKKTEEIIVARGSG